MDGEDGFGLALGCLDAGFFFGAGFEDAGLFFAFCGEDGGLFFAFCFEDGGAAFAFGAHLFFHGVPDGFRGFDVFDFDACDFDAPCVTGFVEDASQFVVDGVAAGQGLVQFECSDDVSEGGGCEVVNGCLWVFGAVCVEFGVGYLVEYDGVNEDGDIVFCDDGLGFVVEEVLLQGDDFCDSFDKGQFCMEANFPCPVVTTEPFDDVGFALGHDSHACYEDEQHEAGQGQYHVVCLVEVFEGCHEIFGCWFEGCLKVGLYWFILCWFVFALGFPGSGR